MFRKLTVFVLGAGASVHYGYPTGAELIDGVRERAGVLLRHVEGRIKDRLNNMLDYQTAHYGQFDPASMEHHKRTRSECEQFINNLNEFNPLSIDHFLNQHPSLAPLGKMLIANVLRSRQRQTKERFPGDGAVDAIQRTRHDWLRFVTHELTSGASRDDFVSGNNVKFVTFNYETSLERRLTSALTASEVLGENVLIDSFLRDRIIHVYGSLRDIPVAGEDHDTDREWNNAFRAGQDLCVIADFDKDRYLAEQRLATSWLQAAQEIFILGYGFDETNSRLIGLGQLQGEMGRSSHKNVHITNLDDRGNINAEIQKLFVIGETIGENPRITRDMSRTRIVKISKKNVYQALAEDFSLRS